MFFYIFQLCKKLMALPLLPHQHVVQVFETITANLDDQVPAITEPTNNDKHITTLFRILAKQHLLRHILLQLQYN